jgi:hypothetical protein
MVKYLIPADKAMQQRGYRQKQMLDIIHSGKVSLCDSRGNELCIVDLPSGDEVAIIDCIADGIAKYQGTERSNDDSWLKYKGEYVQLNYSQFTAVADEMYPTSQSKVAAPQQTKTQSAVSQNKARGRNQEHAWAENRRKGQVRRKNAFNWDATIADAKTKREDKGRPLTKQKDVLPIAKKNGFKPPENAKAGGIYCAAFKALWAALPEGVADKVNRAKGKQ